MGHTLGAAGGLEAIVCAQVLRHGEIPPTKNLENPALDDGCDLNYCPGEKVGLFFRLPFLRQENTVGNTHTETFSGV